MTHGDQQSKNRQYNSRLQLTQITVGAGGSQFGETIGYCPGGGSSCTTNNGNIMKISLTTPGVDQVFGYDPINRLTSMQEGTPTAIQNGTAPAQAWDYDNRGNRFYTGTPTLPVSSYLPAGAGIYNAYNQTTTAGALHADRGNQTAIGLSSGTYAYTFQYDGENRMVTAANGGTTVYSYDGDGRRIQKQSGGTTTFVYDAFGNLAAEYGGTVATACTTCYVTEDHLGSTRVLTDSSGVVKERHDFMPFGEELFAGINRRTATQGYAGRFEP